MIVNPKYQKNQNVNRYLENEILDAPQEVLILKVYDFAIANAKQKNIEKTNKAIQVLIDSLNFKDEEATQMSMDLFNLYRFCQDQTRKRNFDLVEKMLSELRNTWEQVFKQKEN
ncbi:MAG TPA: flagellar protein FliS [Ignavibacteriales bacterium]|jgi:flagellin-specific chaperone FliS|nr:flagellar protein FliS [Ignavibacteriales bacterium]